MFKLEKRINGPETITPRAPSLVSLCTKTNQLKVTLIIANMITQELIQNADDAGAKTVHFYIDHTQHRAQEGPLLHSKLAKFLGPSLIAFNDAVFRKEDWKGIQEVQESVKADDPFKVGQFGIGFNSVYHVTGKYRH